MHRADALPESPPAYGGVAALLPYLLPVALGLFSAALAIVAGRLELKFVAGLVVVVPFGLALLLLRTEERLTAVFVALLALTLCMNLDVTFMWRRHVGSSAGVQISAGLLCALALWTIWLIPYLRRVRPVLMRLNVLQVSTVLLYMLAGVMSLVNAVFPGLVALELLRLSMLLLIMLAVMNLADIRYLKVFVFFLSVGVVLQGALAGGQHLTGSSLGLEVFGAAAQISQDIGYSFIRPTGTGGHPNILAYFLELSIPLTLAMVFAPQPAWLRCWYLFATLCGLGALVLTLSRAAWLTVPISFGIVLLLLASRLLLQLRTIVLVLLLAVAMVIASFYIAPIVYKRFVHDDYRSSAMRMPMNRAAWDVIKQYPVLGVGMNNFSQVYRAYDRTTESRVFTEKIYQGKHRLYVPFKHVVHNMFLMIWGEVGTLGLLAFLSMFAATFVNAWRVYQRGPPWLAASVVGICAGLLGHMAHGMLDPGFPLMMHISTLVFCYMGFVAAAELITRRSDQSIRKASRSPVPAGSTPPRPLVAPSP